MNTETNIKLEFNLNDMVSVKLTDAGRDELKKQHLELYKYRNTIPEFEPPKEDESGYSEWQLWDLMSKFGKKIYLGGPNMFDLNILITFENGTKCTI